MEIVEAIKNGNLHKVIELLNYGIDPNLIIEIDATPRFARYTYNLLSYSLHCKRYDIFNVLINRGADINITFNYNQNIISYCIFFCSINDLYKLLEFTPNIYKVITFNRTIISVIKNLIKIYNNSNDSYFIKSTQQLVKAYDLLILADKACCSDLNYIKSQIILSANINKICYIPIKSWINYLSKYSCLELFNWIKPNVRVGYLLGKDKNNNKMKQYIREQVCQEGLIGQLIMSYLENKFISEFRNLLFKKLI